MTASIPNFQRTVAEIEQNSWWREALGDNPKSFEFTYSIDERGNESISEVPTEPFEALLLRVRRLTMNDSSEQLHLIRKALKATAVHDVDRNLLDVWKKYWRLAFIKEPFEIERSGQRQVMTGYKVYDCFVNGEYFHSDDAAYNVILYGQPTVSPSARSFLFYRNMFHAVVTDICFAAIALDRYIANGYSFCEMGLKGLPTVFDFVLWRKRAQQLDDQYKIFNDWIMSNGGCKKCRWT